MYFIITNANNNNIKIGKFTYKEYRHHYVLNKLFDITKCNDDNYQLLSLCRFYKAKYIRGVLEKSQKKEQIFSDRYYLYDPKTVKRFNLKVNSVYIAGACANGAVEFLEWWFKSNLPLKYNIFALNWASENGHVNVLEWWKNSGLELKYTEEALNCASKNGNVNVLEWWFKSGLPLKYNTGTLRLAYRNKIALRCWKKFGLNPK